MSDYEWIFQMGDNGILLLDETYRIKNVNRMATELTGYPYETLIGTDFSSLLDPKGRGFLFELCEGSPALESRRFCMEMEIVVSSGDPHPFEVCVSTAGTPDNKKKIAIFVRDLTERILMEREIRRSNEFMTSLIESSYDGIIAADMKGTIIIFNKGAENLLGYTAEEVIGKMNAASLYPPGVAQDIMRKLRDEKYGGKGKLAAQRYVGIARSGEQIPVMLSGSLIYQDGREVATVGFFYDLRDILSAQQDLLESEKNFHYLFETVRHGLYFSSREGRFIDCNQTLLDMLGYASQGGVPVHRHPDAALRRPGRAPEVPGDHRARRLREGLRGHVQEEKRPAHRRAADRPHEKGPVGHLVSGAGHRRDRAPDTGAADAPVGQDGLPREACRRRRPRDQ